MSSCFATHSFGSLVPNFGCIFCGLFKLTNFFKTTNITYIEVPSNEKVIQLKKNKLSDSEEVLLHIFWKQGKALTSTEIFDITQKSQDLSSWSKNYILKMLTSLQEKEMLAICGVVREGKKYVRQFSPCLSKEEYIADVLDQQGINTSSLAKIAVALVKKQEAKGGDEMHDQLIAELEQMIDDFEQSGDKNNGSCK